MAGLDVGASNNGLKQLRLALKVAAKNWLLLLLLPAIAYGYARVLTHQQMDYYGARAEVLLEEKDEYDKAREMVEGVISRRFQRQGPDIANQVRILKSRDLVAKAVGDLDHNITSKIEPIRITAWLTATPTANESSLSNHLQSCSPQTDYRHFLLTLNCVNHSVDSCSS